MPTSNDSNDQPAFSGAAIEAVEGWVRGGGSLLLITDHWPYGAANASLAERFGVRMGQGLVEDPEHCEPGRGESHLVFSAQNGLLRDHPVVQGRAPGARARRMLTFTGQTLDRPFTSTASLTLSESASKRAHTNSQS